MIRRKPVLASKDSVRAGTLMAYVNNIKAHKFIAVSVGYPLEEIFEVFVEDVGIENLPLYLDIEYADSSLTLNSLFSTKAELEEAEQENIRRWRAMILEVLGRERAASPWRGARNRKYERVTYV